MMSYFHVIDLMINGKFLVSAAAAAHFIFRWNMYITIVYVFFCFMSAKPRNALLIIIHNGKKLYTQQVRDVERLQFVCVSCFFLFFFFVVDLDLRHHIEMIKKTHYLSLCKIERQQVIALIGLLASIAHFNVHDALVKTFI